MILLYLDFLYVRKFAYCYILLLYLILYYRKLVSVHFVDKYVDWSIFFKLKKKISLQISQSKLALLGEIANEKGLDAQNYQCKGCTRPVGLSMYYSY